MGRLRSGGRISVHALELGGLECMVGLDWLDLRVVSMTYRLACLDSALDMSNRAPVWSGVLCRFPEIVE